MYMAFNPYIIRKTAGAFESLYPERNQREEKEWNIGCTRSWAKIKITATTATW